MTLTSTPRPVPRRAGLPRRGGGRRGGGAVGRRRRQGRAGGQKRHQPSRWFEQPRLRHKPGRRGAVRSARAAVSHAAQCLTRWAGAACHRARTSILGASLLYAPPFWAAEEARATCARIAASPQATRRRGYKDTPSALLTACAAQCDPADGGAESAEPRAAQPRSGPARGG
jgi:hypothetical protein